MVYVLVISTVFVLVATMVFLLILQRSAARKKKTSLPTLPGETGATRSVIQQAESRRVHYQDSQKEPISHTLNGHNGHSHYGEQGVNQNKTRSGGLFTYNQTQNHLKSTPSNPQSLSGSLPPSLSDNRHTNSSLNELLREYDRGMRTSFDDSLGAIIFVTTNVVMMNPQEVTLAFQACTHQIEAVLRTKGIRRAALLTDIGGLMIGRDAVAHWGQSLKNCLEQICIKVNTDTYLVAHYNSKTSRPNNEQLQDKIRRIQFMTSASLNSFQSNIFDTREEAVAFLQRMRETYNV